MPPVSFATDIKPLFRPIDIAHMKPHGVKLDDYPYMSDPANNHQNAQDVQDALSRHASSGASGIPRRVKVEHRGQKQLSSSPIRWALKSQGP
jgi:hypothetical protein